VADWIPMCSQRLRLECGTDGLPLLGRELDRRLASPDSRFRRRHEWCLWVRVYNWMSISSCRLTFRLSSQLDLQLHDPTDAPFRRRRRRVGDQDRVSFRRTRFHRARLDLLLCSRAQGSKLCRGASQTNVCSHSQYLIQYHPSTARRALQQAHPGAEIRHDQDLPTRAGARGLKGCFYRLRFCRVYFRV
jgi:hypothetical protein